MECMYCKKIYSNAYTLLTHQRTTRTCLNKQKEHGVNLEKLYACLFCEKNMTSKKRLETHLIVCKLKKNKEETTMAEINNSLQSKQKELESELKATTDKIKELEEKLRERSPQKISNKTHIDTQNITNHNNITIYQVMTPEHVLDVFQKHYKLDTLLGGQKALARFVNEEFLKEHASPIYMCGDRARQKFYMIKDGKKEEDPDCENIIGLSTPGFPHVREVYEDALFTTHKDITEEQIQENYRSITNIDKDRTPFKAELSKIACNTESKTPWQNALVQLQSMREKILPYENA